ncbi:unnamed protein product [Pleuronectes platessa]|uniref:Uncharacterized protein n=1 Tax=Pleuronectes platessa TaxID=8262 RepID=A0A9N7YMQ3_PLEPL|nr:unnamed protein product [Pleuronectes platessa]
MSPHSRKGQVQIPVQLGPPRWTLLRLYRVHRDALERGPFGRPALNKLQTPAALRWVETARGKVKVTRLRAEGLEGGSTSYLLLPSASTLDQDPGSGHSEAAGQYSSPREVSVSAARTERGVERSGFSFLLKDTSAGQLLELIYLEKLLFFSPNLELFYQH